MADGKPTGKTFFSPIFCRSEPLIQSGQDGEAEAAGELIKPGGWHADVPPWARTAPARSFIVFGGAASTL
jgi:hypothetical protein